MRIFKEKDYDAMSRRAASFIAAQLMLNPRSVLGLATGGTPVGTYKTLISMYQDGDVDFSGITTVNLDEYRGLSGNDVQSYRHFMDEQLFDHINIDKARTFIPDGMATDAEAECAAYDARIDALSGIDLQLLGIGGNGHIGFNEPADSFAAATHRVTLTRSTIDANARFFEDIADVPTEAYTMGIGSIFRARKILLLVSGDSKAQIIRDACTGPVTPALPASILQLHGDVTIIGDEASLHLLG